MTKLFKYKYSFLLPLYLVTQLAGATAIAAPTLYPKDFNLLSRIQNPTSSNLVADDNDPRTIYVMPPNEAYGQVAGLHTLNANLLFCSNLQGLARQSQGLEARVEKVQLELDGELKNLSKYDERITIARINAAQYATEQHLADLIKIDGDLATANANINTNLAQLETCKTGCDGLAVQIQQSQAQVRDLMKARTNFVIKNLAAARVYDQKKQVVDALVNEKASHLDNYDLIVNKLNVAHGQILSLFTTYGNMEGARAALQYRSAWNTNTSKLRELNPGLNFALMNTQNAKIYPGVLGVSGLPASGAVIGFEMPGSAGMKDGAISFPTYPSAIDGNVVLSLLGACPMVKPNFFTFDADTSPQNMKYGMLISYEFPSTMHLKMKVTYNMHKFYQLIRSSGSSGGLFRSHSWSNTEERAVFNDSFRVNWTIDDPANSLTDDQRMAMERDARVQIMSRLLNLAIPQTPNAGALIAASAPPVHGAVVVADSLMKACPGNIYCAGGALVMNALDAIFGSSSSSSSYTKIEDRDLTEEFDMAKVVLKPWVTSYKMKNSVSL